MPKTDFYGFWALNTDNFVKKIDFIMKFSQNVYFDFIYNIDKYYSDFGNHGNVTLVLKSKLNDKKTIQLA